MEEEWWVTLQCLGYQQATANNNQKHNDAQAFAFGPLKSGERVVSSSVELGIRSSDTNKQPRVTALGIFTNRGRSFLATAPTESVENGKYMKNGVAYESVTVHHNDVPIENGTFKGFFGRSDDTTEEGAIWRLGLIWCHANGPKDSTSAEAKPLALSSISSMVSDTHNPQSGYFSPNDWKHDSPTMTSRTEIAFNPSYSESPLFISGLEHIDIGRNTPIHLDSRHLSLTKDKVTCVLRTVGHNSYMPASKWLAIPRSEKHVEVGEYEIVGDERSVPSSESWPGKQVTIPFAKPFQNAPVVITWLCTVTNKSDHYSAWVDAVDTTLEGSSINIEKNGREWKRFHRHAHWLDRI